LMLMIIALMMLIVVDHSSTLSPFMISLNDVVDHSSSLSPFMISLNDVDP